MAEWITKLDQYAFDKELTLIIMTCIGWKQKY